MDWDGDILDGDPIALWVSIDDLNDAGGRLVGAAATSDSGEYHVQPHRLGELLVAHKDREWISHDVRRWFWPVRDHLHRHSKDVALAVLWDLIRKCRLQDVQILDQLLRLANAVEHPKPRSLGDLTIKYCGTSEAAGPSNSSGVVGEAPAIRKVHQILKESASDFIGNAQQPESYGILAHGLQLQGAIGLAQISRTSLPVNPDVIPALRDRCQTWLTECTEKLREHPPTRHCFRWTTDERIQTTRKGHLKVREHTLQDWLWEVVERMRGRHNLPVEPPQTDAGQIASDPNYWGFLVDCEPHLRHWAGAVFAAQIERYLQSVENVDTPAFRAKYAVLPRIRPLGLDPNELRSLVDEPVFRPRPGYVLLVLKLQNLLVRAFAATLETSSPKRLRTFLLEHEGPLLEAAKQLAGFVEDDEFEEFKQEDERGYRYYVNLAEALLEVVPLGLGATHMAELLTNRYGFEIAAAEAEQLQTQLFEIYPELGQEYFFDETYGRLARALGVEVHELDEQIGHIPSAKASLRKVLWGEVEASTEFWNRLRQLNKNSESEFTELLEQGKGSPELCLRVLAEYACTPTGRLHGPKPFWAARVSEVLDTADDARKAALFRLCAEGYQLVGFGDDEIVAEVSASNTSEDVARHAKQLAREGAESVLPGIPVQCEARGADGW